MKLVIEQVDNGYVLTSPNMLGDGVEREVIECEDIDCAYDKGHVNLLYTIIDNLGIYGSKHHPFRIRVILEKQNDD